MKLREAWASSRQRLESADIPDASLEAEVLLRHTLSINRATFFASLEHEPSVSDANSFERFVERRIVGEPLAYITGHREFYGLDFVVTPDVLVPRQETEMLVEAVLQFAKGRLTPSPFKEEGWGEDGGDLTIADIGTGSGAIAIALGHSLPDAIVNATDISPDALRVADTNRRKHGVEDRVHIQQGDLFDALDGPMDVIVSNPPYLSSKEVGVLPSDVQHEPMTALSAGLDGMDVLRRLIESTPSYLNPGGLLVVEIDPRRFDSVMALTAAVFDDSELSLVRDHAGLPRMVTVSLSKNAAHSITPVRPTLP